MATEEGRQCAGEGCSAPPGGLCTLQLLTWSCCPESHSIGALELIRGSSVLMEMKLQRPNSVLHQLLELTNKEIYSKPNFHRLQSSLEKWNTKGGKVIWRSEKTVLW